MTAFARRYFTLLWIAALLVACLVAFGVDVEGGAWGALRITLLVASIAVLIALGFWALRQRRRQ